MAIDCAFIIENIQSRLSGLKTQYKDDSSLGMQLAALVNELHFLKTQADGFGLAKAAISESESLLTCVIDSFNVGVVVIDPHFRIMFANKYHRQGFAHIDFSKQPYCYQIFHDSQQKESCPFCPVRKMLQDGNCHERVINFVKEGQLLYIRLLASPVRDRDGNIIAAVELAENITDRVLAEEEIRKLSLAIEQNPGPVVITDVGGAVEYVNSKFTQVTGYTLAEIKGKTPRILKSGFQSDEEYRKLWQTISEGKEYSGEFYNRKKNGDHYWALTSVSPLVNKEGKTICFIGVQQDITDRKLMEAELIEMNERLKYLSLHDSLTGVGNRLFFEQQLLHAEKEKTGSVGIVICDVDGLKVVNDTFGHTFGDNLLIVAANAIKEAAQGANIVCRIGGDEFSIMFLECNQHTIQECVGKIRLACQKYNSNNPFYPLSISIGYAISDEMTGEVLEIYREADNRMYREKLHQSQSARSEVVQTLSRALEVRDFLTEGHCERMENLIGQVGQKLHLSERTINDLRLLAQFHDIGKVGIPDSILFKPGPLSPEEFVEMQRHCEIGYRIARSLSYLMPIAEGILKHHERWDGNGYPFRLKGKEIPLESRILAIVDSFDAMTNERPYRRAMSQDAAIAELRRCSGSQFDPDLVEFFISILKDASTG